MKNIHRIKNKDAYKKCQKVPKRELSLSQKRLIRAVYNDRDWDWSFIYDLLYVKLNNILDYSMNNTVTYTENWRPEWLKRAISLIDFIKNNCYDKPVNVNLNNVSRFGLEAVREYNLLLEYEKEKRENNGERIGHIGDKEITINIDNLIKYCKEEIYHIKARHLFFKILDNYIEHWWD